MNRPLSLTCVLLVVGSCLAQSLPTTANTRPQPRPQQGFARRFADRVACDQLTIECSKETRHRFNAIWLLPIAATAAFIPADKHIAGEVPHGSASGSRDISNVGLYGSMGTLGALGVWGLTRHSRDDVQGHRARETALLGAEALANAGFVYVMANVVAGRERPLTGSGNGLFWRDHTWDASFPSGHASMTFAIDTVLAHEYPSVKSRWIWYSVATGTAATRVLGQKHFPADVVAGATLGFWFGRHIFKAHHRE